MAFFHLLAEVAHITIDHDAHLVRKIDVFFPVGLFVQTLGAGGNVVDLVWDRLQAVGLDGQKIALSLQGVE